MNFAPPSRCPVCGGELVVSKLVCPRCASELTGSFAACRYCALNGKLRLFLETFLKCRGNIKEVERSLSVSYPTVKGLLDELLAALFPEEAPPEPAPSSTEVLDRLEKGEITAAEAARLLAKGDEGR